MAARCGTPIASNKSEPVTSGVAVIYFANPLSFGPHSLSNLLNYSLRMKMIIGLGDIPFSYLFYKHASFRISWWNLTFSILLWHLLVVQFSTASTSVRFCSSPSQWAPYCSLPIFNFLFHTVLFSPISYPFICFLIGAIFILQTTCKLPREATLRIFIMFCQLASVPSQLSVFLGCIFCNFTLFSLWILVITY